MILLLLSLKTVWAEIPANPTGLVIKPSAYSVAETLDRFETIARKKGITIFARVDHAGGASNAGLTLPATELLIFGNPKLGTPLMNSQRLAAIDLPLKLLAWEDDKGKVWLAYNDPAYLATRHAISDQTNVIKKMSAALNKLSDFAAKKIPAQ
jgi:uncharacterized protein (DUF302 family)